MSAASSGVPVPSPVPGPAYKTRKRHEHPNHARLLNFTCFHNRPFLATDRARTWLIEAIAAAMDAHAFRLWAYTIMPDHVHLLLWPRGPVPPILTSIKQSVSKRAVAWAKAHDPNLLHAMRDEQPSGAHFFRFWQRGGGYDRNLWEPKPIWDAIDYIHMNPVNAGLCERPTDWPWSSASMFTPQREGPLPIDFASIPPRPS